MKLNYFFRKSKNLKILGVNDTNFSEKHNFEEWEVAGY